MSEEGEGEEGGARSAAAPDGGRFSGTFLPRVWCVCVYVCARARACELCVGMCVRACVSCVCVWVCVRAHSFNELASEMSLQRSRVGGTEQARGFRVCPV